MKARQFDKIVTSKKQVKALILALKECPNEALKLFEPGQNRIICMAEIGLISEARAEALKINYTSALYYLNSKRISIILQN